MPDQTKKRPDIRNIGLGDLMSYRLPLAGLVSILHRVSGIFLFFMLPFVIWMFGMSLHDRQTYEQFVSLFDRGCWLIPGWFIKLICLAMIWAFLHHLCAGFRHLFADVFHNVSKQQGKKTALASLCVSLLLTLALGAKLFGLY